VHSRKTGTLIILDGWGISTKKDNNPIALARTPFYDSLKKEKITAVGRKVGMPSDAKGSTAVGHEVLSGAKYRHPMLRISEDIKQGVLINSVLDRRLDKTASKGGALHLMGLVSRNKEHSHIAHLYGIMRRAVQKNIKKVYIHFFSDGRGTPPFSAVRYAEDLIEKAESIGGNKAAIRIATVGGRDMTMNRSTDAWYKTENTYRAVIEGISEDRKENIFAALKEDYDKGITDQYVKIRTLGNYEGVSSNDTLIHWNFRKDRAALLMQMFLESENKLRSLTGNARFKRLKHRNNLDYGSLDFLTLVESYNGIKCPVAYPDIKKEHSFGSLLQEYGYRQYRVSGVDKKHALTLLSGGTREKAFENEYRIVVSLNPEMEEYIKEYDKKKGEEGYTLDPYEKFPEIELPRLTDKVIELIKKPDNKKFIIVNISNPDMVGHTGSITAGIRAAESVDRSLAEIYKAARNEGSPLFVTADHGNLEQAVTEEGDVSTFHTKNPVPFSVANMNVEISKGGRLNDVASSLLYLMEPEKKMDILEKLEGNVIVRGFFNEKQI